MDTNGIRFAFDSLRMALDGITASIEAKDPSDTETSVENIVEMLGRIAQSQKILALVQCLEHVKDTPDRDEIVKDLKRRMAQVLRP